MKIGTISNESGYLLDLTQYVIIFDKIKIMLRTLATVNVLYKELLLLYQKRIKEGFSMKLWNKTILAAAITLLIAGCDDADKKVDSNLNQAKEAASQIKDAAADKASSIKDEADKHIDAVKQEADKQADQLTEKAKSIKAEADDKAQSLADQAKAKGDDVKADAKQKSDQVVEKAEQIKAQAISGANELATDAAAKTQEIKDSMKKDNTPAQADSTPNENKQ